MSICEIVNKTEEFVTRTPFFVVDKTDWIQCRYLLVRVNPTTDALQTDFSAPSGPPCTGYIEQDPAYVILSEGSEPLRIPSRANSLARQDEYQETASDPMTTGPIGASMTGHKDDSDDFNGGDDVEFLMDDVMLPGEGAQGQKRKRSISSEQ